MLKAIHLRTIFLFLVVSSIFTSISFAQSNQAVSESTSFKAVIDKSFQELDESNYSEEVQLKYADIFLKYYLNTPNEKYSEWALAHAFKFWGNLGAVDKAEKAMAQLDYDAESWSYFIPFIPNLYINSENKTLEDAVELIESLTNKLTHPKSNSRLYWWLAGYYQENEEIEKIKTCSAGND